MDLLGPLDAGFFLGETMADYKFGAVSNGKLSSCCQELRVLANRAIVLSPYDFTIIWGWRGEEIQNALFASGASEKEWPKSKHNVEDIHGSPYSEALDFGVYQSGVGVLWKNTHAFAVVAGCFFAAGKEQGIDLKWGGDWDTNPQTGQKLLDYGHIEVIV